MASNLHNAARAQSEQIFRPRRPIASVQTVPRLQTDSHLAGQIDLEPTILASRIAFPLIALRQD
jgi:hypothetical protein